MSSSTKDISAAQNVSVTSQTAQRKAARETPLPRHRHPLSPPANVITLPQTAQLEALYTIIRDKNTSRGDFIFYTDRIIRLLVEEGLNHLPVIPRTVETPTVSRWFDLPLCWGLHILCQSSNQVK